MGLIKGIHHIEMISGRFHEICEYFVRSLGYQFFATVKDGVTQRAALKNGKSVFVLRNGQSHLSPRNRFVHANYLDGGLVDSVYNIALEVSNVDECVHGVLRAGGEVVSKPSVYGDHHGDVKVATIRSCVGNVIHTLIDSSNYKGLFLPDYVSPAPMQHGLSQPIDTSGLHQVNRLYHCNPRPEDIIIDSDHLTFALHKGESDRILKWYNKAFGMKRISVNTDETLQDGFIVEHEMNGLKLKAFDYWKCAETSIENQQGTFKFVLAEPLYESVPNQITCFLKEHGGPGIQHIGLLVKNIVDAARIFGRRGVDFLPPPSIYYQEQEKLKQIHSLGLNPSALADHGILLDVEEWEDSKDIGYLLQVFTRPLFKKDTFFLELIERRGARGFGAGNIKALWRAVDLYLKASG